MTQNQFLGADLGPLVLALGGVGDLEQVLAETLAQITANNFPLRAEALAEQICSKQPHVVGLQEVFRFTINDISGPPAPLPFVDHLEELMSKIADQCGNYVVGASVQHIDVAQDVPGFGTIGFTDRDVILVRDDVLSTPIPFVGNACPDESTVSGVFGVPPSGCHFTNLVPLPLPFGEILRGYVGVTAFVEGVPHNVVNTHLEVMQPDPMNPLSTFFQAAQATELITVLSQLPDEVRTILVGDINSSPDDAADPTLFFVPPYAQFTNGVDLAGQPIQSPSTYADAWNFRRGRDPGFTCCHSEDLTTRRTDHDERIDVIFSLQTPSRVKANVMGGEASDRVMGLWPSDHCTVDGDITF
ncbi:MAG: hypothetical protein JRF61_14025 [Deltaproteobacteria bacterium]|jgi:endonuclease/exonuclease/phosphatase family metal-dependent hydrolase|nr:hypothetical protein [Deltaproteobacteria bacterium]